MLTLFDEAKAHLVANCPTLLRVETGMSVDAVEVFAVSPADVTALICPLHEIASPVRDAAMMVSQQITWRFGVVLTLGFPGGFPEFMTARLAIVDALRGWSPTGADMPVTYAGGKTLIYDVSDAGGSWRYLLEFSVPERTSYGHQS